ncbi:hypothetical protein HYQ43_17290 [Paracoccus pantotrophus]|uniref:Uncharacterized protein n=1 Tax=Paracoccus pantotrophus TaxID=82367 RepID=A0A7H9BYN8_PARPN|nr:hypothetical protein [Paracoccus pantotrophus]QLH15886.1 hypothetical protein HYQ43_17290 [Paracoccus pantotrophus]
MLRTVSATCSALALVPGAVLLAEDAQSFDRLAYVVAAEESCSSYGSNERGVRETVTRPTHYELDFSAEFGTSSMAQDPIISSAGSWADDAVRASDWVIAEQRLWEVSQLEHGWYGDGSRAATISAKLGAAALLCELEQALPEGPAPLVSIDTDGYIVFSWKRGLLVGSLSVFDYDTFAYYVERGEGNFASNGEAQLSKGLPADLVQILTT